MKIARSRLSARLKACFVAVGATGPHDLARFVRQHETKEQVLAGCLAPRDDGPATSEELESFKELSQVARRCAARARDVDAGSRDYVPEAERMRNEKGAADAATEAWYANGGRSRDTVTHQPQHKQHARARSTLHAGCRTGTKQGSAQERDRDTRMKYVNNIVDHMMQLRPVPPSVEAAAAAGDATGLLSLNAAGRRASTLRVRLRSWKAFERWLRAAYDVPLPTDWRMLLESMIVRVAEPCGRQSLFSLYYSAMLWEHATGWSLTHDPLWRAGVDEMLAMVFGRAGHREATTAPPPLLRHFVCLREDCDERGRPVMVACMRSVEASPSQGRVTFR